MKKQMLFILALLAQTSLLFSRPPTSLSGLAHGYYRSHAELRLPETDAGIILFTANTDYPEISFGTGTRIYSGNTILKDGPRTYWSSGGSHNKGTYKSRTSSGTSVVSRMPISNPQKKFWVIYKNGLHMIGVGDIPGKNLLLSQPSPDRSNLRGVTHFGFTGSGSHYTNIRVQKISTSEHKSALDGPTEKSAYSRLQELGSDWIGDWQQVTSGPYERSASHPDFKFAHPTRGGFIVRASNAGNEPLFNFSDRDHRFTHPLIRVSDFDGGSNLAFRQFYGGEKSNNWQRHKRTYKGALPTYWVIYYDGHVYVGRGVEVGKNLLIDKPYHMTQEREYNITHFGFHGTGGNSARGTTVDARGFAITPRLIGSLKLTPPFKKKATGMGAGVYAGHSSWKLPERDKGVVIFNSQTMYCGLSFGTGVTDDGKLENNRYRISGLHTSSYFWFGDYSSPGNTITKHITPSQEWSKIDQDKPTQFWVSFDHGTVSWGRGSVPGEEVLIDAPIILAGTTAGTTHFGFDGSNRSFDQITIKQLTPEMREKINRIKQVKGLAHGYYRSHQLLKFPQKDRAVLQFTANTKYPEVSFSQNIKRHGSATILADGPRTYWSQNGTVHAIQSAGKIVEIKRISSKNQSEKFWIIYDHGEYTIGTGSTPGENPLIEHSYQDKTGVNGVQYFGFTGNNSLYSNLTITPLTDEHTSRLKKAFEKKAWEKTKQELSTLTGDALLKKEQELEKQLATYTAQLENYKKSIN